MTIGKRFAVQGALTVAVVSFLWPLAAPAQAESLPNCPDGPTFSDSIDTAAWPPVHVMAGTGDITSWTLCEVTSLESTP